MADLQVAMRWEKYVPEFDDNHKLPVPFYFELACGLTRAQMVALDAEIRRVNAAAKAAGESVPVPKGAPSLTAAEEDALVDEYKGQVAAATIEAQITGFAKALEPYVKFGAETLTIGGQPIRVLEQYFRATAVVNDLAGFNEPIAALRLANTLGGRQVVFSKRSSGTGASTRAPSNGSAGSQTAAK